MQSSFFPVSKPLARIGIGTYAQWAPGEKKHGLSSNLLTLMSYFFDDHIFDRSNTDEIAGAYTGNWKDYADKILTYARSKNFMKQTESRHSPAEK